MDLRYLLTYIAILTWKQKIALKENLIRSARQGHNRPIDVTLPPRMFGWVVVFWKKNSHQNFDPYLLRNKTLTDFPGDEAFFFEKKEIKMAN